MITMILCHYIQIKHTLQVTGTTCNILVFHYGIFELGAPSTRVPGLRLRFLPGIESVTKIWPKGCLVSQGSNFDPGTGNTLE
jgi:hypothetical protein